VRGIKVYKRNGAGKRVKDDEPGVWNYAVSWEGKRKRKACPGATKSQTEAIARAELDKMRTGEAAKEEAEQKRDRTIQTLTDEIVSLRRQLESKDSNKGEKKPEIEFTRFRDQVYLPHKKISNKATYGIYENMAPIYDPFKGRMLHAIQTEDVQDWWRERANTKTRTGGERSHAALNRELNVLGGLFKVAIDLKFIKRNPCNGIKRFPDDGGRLTHFEDGDESKLLAAMTGTKEKFKPIVIITIHTGLRLREVTENLKWENIHMSDDPEKRAITVYGKGDKWRRLPINDVAYGVLKELRAKSKGRGRVFSGPGFGPHNVCRQVSEACKAAGLPDLSLHSARHTFVTRLLENGANLEQARLLAGHSNSRTTQRYAHLAQSRSLHRAVQTLVPSGGPDPEKGPFGTGKRQDDDTTTE
jgi:integrase